MNAKSTTDKIVDGFAWFDKQSRGTKRTILLGGIVGAPAAIALATVGPGAALASLIPAAALLTGKAISKMARKAQAARAGGEESASTPKNYNWHAAKATAGGVAAAGLTAEALTENGKPADDGEDGDGTGIDDLLDGIVD